MSGTRPLRCDPLTARLGRDVRDRLRASLTCPMPLIVAADRAPLYRSAAIRCRCQARRDHFGVKSWRSKLREGFARGRAVQWRSTELPVVGGVAVRCYCTDRYLAAGAGVELSAAVLVSSVNISRWN
jgi:hypothetical protein